MQIIGVFNIWIGVLLLGGDPAAQNMVRRFHLYCITPENVSLLHRKYDVYIILDAI